MFNTQDKLFKKVIIENQDTLLSKPNKKKQIIPFETKMKLKMLF